MDYYIIPPTGKTGVAFGLVEGRTGGRIKVISEVSNDKEAEFAFYLGINKRRCFYPIISREAEYNKWYRFISAANEEFEIYYTSLPEATTKKMPIREVAKKIRNIENPSNDKSVYIRLVKPTVIEYAVATSVSEITENMTESIEF
jgi:hypothetical protein